MVFCDTAEPCPFCGYNEIEAGEVKNPTAWWDGNMRGENCWVIMCIRCNANIKANTLSEAIELWNRRVVPCP